MKTALIHNIDKSNLCQLWHLPRFSIWLLQIENELTQIIIRHFGSKFQISQTLLTMSSRSRSRPLKRFKQRCWKCRGVYIRKEDSAFDFGYCISVECRCSLYRKLDRRQQLLNGRHGRTHVFRKPVMNTQEPHHGLPQSARCQTGSLHLIEEKKDWLLKTELL